jgi:hypothetical protein
MSNQLLILQIKTENGKLKRRKYGKNFHRHGKQ